MLDRMEEECESLGISMTKLLEESVRYFLDRELYAMRDQKDLEKSIANALHSAEGKLAISLALDELLDEHARRKYIEGQ
jgi:hypothetical protein